MLTWDRLELALRGVVKKAAQRDQWDDAEMVEVDTEFKPLLKITFWRTRRGPRPPPGVGGGIEFTT